MMNATNNNDNLWEEKNSTEQSTNCENKSALETKDITNDTQKNVEKAHSKDTTNLKLKIRKKLYYETNKEKKKEYQKLYYESKKEVIKNKQKLHREKTKTNITKKKQIYYKLNKNKFKNYYQLNKDKKKKYYESNKNRIKLRKKEYYKINKEKIKEYRKINKNRFRKHDQNRLKIDIQYKISKTLRSRLNTAIKGNYKSGSAIRDLGCSVGELKIYLESKFQPGMTWENWGVNGWHIDHIKPLVSFDLTNREELLKAVHYTNLQPLWARDNIIKKDNIM